MKTKNTKRLEAIERFNSDIRRMEKEIIEYINLKRLAISTEFPIRAERHQRTIDSIQNHIERTKQTIYYTRLKLPSLSYDE